MASTIHANARTTPRIRREIQMAPSSVSNAALARRYGIHRHTVAKWRKRVSTEDASARPHRLCTTLTEAQEQVVVAIRELLLLPLDDLLVVVREFIEPCLSRSALDRCLRRHGVSDLRTLQRERDGDKAAPHPPKRFKAYEPGFVHIDVKYLPKMQDEASRKYLFVAIDRATRWVYLEIRKDKSAKSAQAFLKALLKKAPFKIRKILTDNGKEFTDRFSAAGERHSLVRIGYPAGVDSLHFTPLGGPDYNPVPAQVTDFLGAEGNRQPSRERPYQLALALSEGMLLGQLQVLQRGLGLFHDPGQPLLIFPHAPQALALVAQLLLQLRQHLLALALPCLQALALLAILHGQLLELPALLLQFGGKPGQLLDPLAELLQLFAARPGEVVVVAQNAVEQRGVTLVQEQLEPLFPSGQVGTPHQGRQFLPYTVEPLLLRCLLLDERRLALLELLALLFNGPQAPGQFADALFQGFQFGADTVFFCPGLLLAALQFIDGAEQRFTLLRAGLGRLRRHFFCGRNIRRCQHHNRHQHRDAGRERQGPIPLLLRSRQGTRSADVPSSPWAAAAP